MIKKIPVFTMVFSLCLALVFSFQKIFNGHREYKQAGVLSNKLNTELEQVLKEKKTLNKQIIQKEDEINKLRVSLQKSEEKLTQLKEPELLRQSLINAQKSVEYLNQELNQIKSEKESLSEANINMSARLQNTTYELIRVMEDFKITKEELNNIEKTRILSLKAEIEKLNNVSGKKDKEMNNIEESLNKLQEERIVLIDTNRNLETTIGKLNADKTSLESNILKLEKSLNKQNAPIVSLQNELDKLNQSLAQKEREIKDWEKRLTEKDSIKFTLQEQVAQQQDSIDKLVLANKSLNVEIAGLKQDLFSKKEEVDNQKQEISTYKNELNNMESRRNELEKELKTAVTESKRVQEVVSDMNSVQAELKQAQAEIEQQGTMLGFLKKEKEDLLSFLSQLNEEKYSLEEKSKSLAAMMDKLNIENTSFKEENSSLSKELAGNKEKLVFLAEIHQNFSKEKEELLSQLQQSQAQVNQLKALKAESEQNLSKYIDQQFKQDKEYKDLKTIYDQAVGKLADLEKANTGVTTENKDLKAQIAHLEIIKDSSEKKLFEYTEKQLNRDREYQALKADYDNLLNKLTKIETRYEFVDKSKNELQVYVSKLKEDKDKTEEELSKFKAKYTDLQLGKDKEYQDIRNNYDQLLAQLDRFKTQNAELETEINKLKLVKDASEVTQLYEKAKEQIEKISEVLVRKELELSMVKKDSLDNQEKVLRLQAEISNLDNRLSESRTAQLKVKELESEKSSLNSLLGNLQKELAKKSDIYQSLQDNLQTLRQELVKKEEENKILDRKISQLQLYNDNAEERLNQQTSQISDMNSFYNRLRGQIGELSETLSEKELGLSKKQIEIASLKGEINTLISRSSMLEQELSQTKNRQNKTMDDLAAAVKLNASLQDRIVGVTNSMENSVSDNESKQKAEELRRKIKVILTPDQER